MLDRVRHRGHTVRIDGTTPRSPTGCPFAREGNPPLAKPMGRVSFGGQGWV
jgi:hypothetical protein